MPENKSAQDIGNAVQVVNNAKSLGMIAIKAAAGDYAGAAAELAKNPQVVKPLLTFVIATLSLLLCSIYLIFFAVPKNLMLEIDPSLGQVNPQNQNEFIKSDGTVVKGQVDPSTGDFISVDGHIYSVSTTAPSNSSDKKDIGFDAFFVFGDYKDSFTEETNLINDIYMERYMEILDKANELAAAKYAEVLAENNAVEPPSSHTVLVDSPWADGRIYEKIATLISAISIYMNDPPDDHKPNVEEIVRKAVDKVIVFYGNEYNSKITEYTVTEMVPKLDEDGEPIIDPKTDEPEMEEKKITKQKVDLVSTIKIGYRGDDYYYENVFFWRKPKDKELTQEEEEKYDPQGENKIFRAEEMGRNLDSLNTMSYTNGEITKFIQDLDLDELGKPQVIMPPKEKTDDDVKISYDDIRGEINETVYNVLDSSPVVTSQFGNRPNPTGGGQEYHTGIDLRYTNGGGDKGKPVYSAMNGTVVRADTTGSSGWGKYVIVYHGVNAQGQSITTLYAHLDSVNVSVNQKINGRTKLGGMGTTGRSTGVHLHFEVRVNGIPSDPKGFI